MYIFPTFAVASAVFTVVKCAPTISPRVPSNLPNPGTNWPLELVPNSSPNAPTWCGSRYVGPLPDITDLYIYAAMAFNYVSMEDNCLTTDGNLLVAAYWDDLTEKVYACTIPRGDWYNNMMQTGAAVAPVWFSRIVTLTDQPVHAEDAAYYWREYTDYFDIGPSNPLDWAYAENLTPEGSKIAVWGAHGQDAFSIIREMGYPISQCDACAQLATSLKVYTEPPVNPWV